MNRRLQFGLVGLNISFTVSAGVVGYWCRQPDVFTGLLVLFAAIAGLTTLIIVSKISD